MMVRSSPAVAGTAIIGLMMGIGAMYFYRSNVHSGGPTTILMENTLAVPLIGFDLPRTKNVAFSTGEKLLYNVIFKGITVGHSTIEITDGPLVNGRPTLKYISKTESSHFFDLFFKVRDENVSTVDKSSLYSLSFNQILHEGHYEAVRRYDFDYINKKFSSEEKKKETLKKFEGTLDGPLYDVLSALYFARTLDLSPGRDISLSIYRDKGRMKLPIKIGAIPKIQKTPLGTFSCLRVEPMINGDSIFKSKDGRLVVWMTNDEKKLPVLIEANASFGIVRVKLAKWEK